MMRQAQTTLEFTRTRAGLTDITEPVATWVLGQGMSTGLLTVFCRHTSASLLIQENADPDVLRDLEDWVTRLAPESSAYRHRDEGADDMPAHLRTALTQTTLGIPLTAGRLALGAWQGLYLFEHRRAPHRREVVLHLVGA